MSTPYVAHPIERRNGGLARGPTARATQAGWRMARPVPGGNQVTLSHLGVLVVVLRRPLRGNGTQDVFDLK